MNFGEKKPDDISIKDQIRSIGMKFNYGPN